MEWVETTGKTVDEAKEAALDELGVDAADAEFDVLAEPKMGLFGRLREEARVRARVRPAIPRQKEDTRDRRRRSAGTRAEASGTEATEATGTPGTDEVTEPSELEAPVLVGAGAAEAGSGGPSGPRRSGRGRGSSGRGGSNGAGAAAAATERAATPEEDPMDGGAMDGGAEVAVAEQAEEAKSFVVGLLDVMSLQGDAVIRLVDEETAEVAVTGADLGLLIGPKGATLSAVQDLMRTVVQRKTGARHGRLLLDVSGYRAKRKEALERFTIKVAADVVAAGSAVALEPMSPADRKIVHDTATDIEGVSTSSDGEEPNRRVVIRPA